MQKNKMRLYTMRELSHVQNLVLENTAEDEFFVVVSVQIYPQIHKYLQNASAVLIWNDFLIKAEQSKQNDSAAQNK